MWDKKARAQAQESLQIEVGAGRDEVLAACDRAASTSKYLVASLEDGVARAYEIRGLGKLMRIGLIHVYVTERAGGPPACSVRTVLARYMTRQSTTFFIPTGPKRITCIETYRKYMKALHVELSMLGEEDPR